MNDHTPVMGSIGMMMLDLNGLKYINGTNTVTYFGLVLFTE